MVSLLHRTGALLLVVGAMALTGCSTTAPTAQRVDAHATVAPLLALPVQALPCSVALQQRLTVMPPQQSAQSLEALLEVDTHTLKLALFHIGQRMGTLQWDGQQLHTELSRWWPSVLPPAQVLSDLQLALWPMDAIQADLPAGWQVEENHSFRRLLYQREVRILVEKNHADALEIVYAPGTSGSWRLRIESPGGAQPCAAQTHTG